jgi:hypothetical protein
MKTFVSIIAFSFLLFAVGHFSHGPFLYHTTPDATSSSSCAQLCLSIFDAPLLKTFTILQLPVERATILPLLLLLLVFLYFFSFYRIRKRPFLQKVFCGIDSIILRE